MIEDKSGWMDIKCVEPKSVWMDLKCVDMRQSV